MQLLSLAKQAGFVRPAYRPDIDGLRAVAVLMVLAFHFLPKAVPGGFVGVDVFFVISGYLITKLVAGEMATHQFSIASFYARRARRMFPALALVLAATLCAGWVLLLPGDYRALGRDAVAAAGFVSNLVLLADYGYFQAASARNSLLHLWSRGIEEQFYLFWPLLLSAIASGQRRVAVVVVVGASFVCNVVLVHWNVAAAFYLPVSRFWELAIGGYLALAAVPMPSTVSGRRRDIASLCGFALLVGSMALIRADVAFPGWWALAPVGGTALILHAGPEAFVNRMLAKPALVAVGLISYPLYLWHWPLLTFVRILRFGSEPPLLIKAALIAATFGLAYLTYRFIETPIRSGRKTIGKVAIAAAALGAVAVVGTTIIFANGFATRFPPGMERMARDMKDEAVARTYYGSCLLDERQTAADFVPACDGEGDPNLRVILLWGDSHAGHLRPGLDALMPSDSASLN